MTTPQQLQSLATRMGLTAVLDASGGYGVVRVIVTNRTSAEVFDPANDAEQSMAVLCWLMKHGCFEKVNEAYVECWGRFIERNRHDNTPHSLRAAILAAALRVAGAT